LTRKNKTKKEVPKRLLSQYYETQMLRTRRDPKLSIIIDDLK
jgi:hypothetical protein